MLPLALLLAAGVTGSKCQTPPRYEGIQWGECRGVANPNDIPIECGNLEVPLDYEDEASEELLTLSLVRYAATAEEKLGTVIVNFGGPGEEGLPSMPIYAPIMSPILGGAFDLVSWDPRGTGSTLRFDCFEPESAPLAIGSKAANESDVAASQLWVEAGITSAVCAAANNETGHLVGMAYSARDMDQIVDALGEDGMLRYWGLSGGTILGATYGALFPDRVGSVLLDGVVNSHQYYHQTGEPEMYSATDAALRGWVEGCLAFPENCALHREGKTADELEAEIKAMFQSLKTNPIPSPVPTSPLDYITYYPLLSRFYLSLYRPGEFSAMATVVDGLLQGNATEAYLFLAASLPSNDTEPDPEVIPRATESILGIRCGDKIPRQETLEDMRPTYLQFEETTEGFLDYWGHSNHMVCARWLLEAKERYEGNFDIETANPILFVGNTFDPVTPFESAKNMSESFQNGAVLHHNGFGHLSFSDASNCTNEAIFNFFAKGEYPEEGTVCEPNLPIFDPKRVEIVSVGS